MTRHDTVNPELDFQFRVFIFQFNVIHPDRKGANYCTMYGHSHLSGSIEFFTGFAYNLSANFAAPCPRRRTCRSESVQTIECLSATSAAYGHLRAFSCTTLFLRKKELGLFP